MEDENQHLYCDAPEWRKVFRSFIIMLPSGGRKSEPLFSSSSQQDIGNQYFNLKWDFSGMVLQKEKPQDLESFVSTYHKKKPA